MGVHVMGVYLLQEELWIISLTICCAKLPRTRIRLALNSHSNSLPRSIPVGRLEAKDTRADAEHEGGDGPDVL
jgi:hypothetical protein